MVNSSTEYRSREIEKYAATLLVVALLAYASFLLVQSWREAEAAQASQAATIAALSGNALDVYFSQLHIGMQSLGADLAGTRSKPDLDRTFTQVQRFQSLHRELGNVMLIRGDGQVLLTGTTPNRPDLPTLAGDPAFEQIRGGLQQGPSFALGRPVLGTIDKSWVIPARYAVADPAGKLAYIISANLPVDMLQRYWIGSTGSGISAQGLLRDDGYLLSRYPLPDVASLDQMYSQPDAGAVAGYLRANSRLQHYPLTLFVEMPIAEIRAAWWRNMHAPYFLMALLLACTFAYYSLKLRRRRAWSEAQRRAELQRRYEEALHERSRNEIFMFASDTLQFSYANDAALDNLGCSLEQLLSKNILSLQPELAIENLGALIEPLRRGEQEAVKYQTVQLRADGSRYPVEVSLQLIAAEDGGEIFLAIVNDISALKQAEENIRKFNAPAERRAARGS